MQDTALIAAIGTAETVSQKADATQSAVDAAVIALNAAIGTFTDAKQDGTKAAVAFTSLTANGSVSGTTTTLTLTFDTDIAGLTAGDIALSSAAVTKGDLTKVGDTTGQYELAVTVTESGSVMATVTKTGFAFDAPQSVTVYYFTGSAIRYGYRYH